MFCERKEKKKKKKKKKKKVSQKNARRFLVRPNGFFCYHTFLAYLPRRTKYNTRIYACENIRGKMSPNYLRRHFWLNYLNYECNRTHVRVFSTSTRISSDFYSINALYQVCFITCLYNTPYLYMFAFFLPSLISSVYQFDLSTSQKLSQKKYSDTIVISALPCT